ncbi:MAG: hemerythrin family protein [Magnetococcales bacterium]|nr:hemerythrin family protein [Magnetococcales bacterium]
MKTMKKVPHRSPNHILDHLEDVYVPVLNKQHQELHRCLLDFNDLVDYLSKKRPTPEEWKKIKETMDFLGNYAKEHFASEELLMKKHSFPKLAEHKKEHDDFVKKYGELYHYLFDHGDILCVVDAKFFLLHWFSHHVNHIDVEYRDHFRKCGLLHNHC